MPFEAVHNFPKAVFPETLRPDLAGRFARCGCGKTLPSNPETMFGFEYCGPGSREAKEICECGYHLNTHQAGFKCQTFTARGPQEFDRFYCGCRGWD